MVERFVALDIKGELGVGATKVGEVLNIKMTPEVAKQKDDPKYEYKVEGILRGVLMRIVFARNYKDLATALTESAAKLSAGSLDAGQLDLIKGRVVDVANQMGGAEDRGLAKTLESLFGKGDYVGAAQKLKEAANVVDSGLKPADRVVVAALLDRIKTKSHMSETQLLKLAEDFETQIFQKQGDLSGEMVTKVDKLQELIVKQEMKILEDDKDVLPVPVELQVTIGNTTKLNVNTELGSLATIPVNERKFIQDLVGKSERFGAQPKTRSGGKGAPPITERVWNFERMRPYEVKLIWLRTSRILAEHETTLSTPGAAETKALLEKMRDGSRQAIMNANEEGGSGGAARAENGRETPRQRAINRASRPPELELGFFGDPRYAINGVTGVDSILRLQMDRLSERYGDPTEEMYGRTAKALTDLRERRPELRRLLRNEDGKWKWFGSDKEYFDLCREEIYDIQGSLTQENMGNLVFEDSAQTYLALMRVDVGKNLELENAKDAITKMLYIDYAVRNMWKSGANVETWQRVAGIMTREREEGFFEIMNIGENLKVRDAEGNWIELGRFTADDLMSLREMKVPGKNRTWKADLATQSSALKEKRMPDFARQLSLRMVEKRELMWLAGDRKGGLSKAAARAERTKIMSGEYSFEEKQLRWIMRYGDFLGGATLRDGERSINVHLRDNKMEIADHPLGEFAIKTGPWAVIYYYQYEVTKYGGDAVGNLFLPNVSMLSYARGETLAPFIKKDSSVEAGMMTASGEYKDTGTGAKEFFFEGGHEAEAERFTDFWGDVIFDTRTGNVSKTAIHRTVDMIRKKGRIKLAAWDAAGKTGFVEDMNFKNMEEMLGKAMGIKNFRMPGENNRDKFEWMVDNFDYTFWRKDTMKAKREGDWVNKYVAKKYVETYELLAGFLNAPGLATKVAARDKIGEYAGGAGMEAWDSQAQAFIDHNNKIWYTGPETAPGSSAKAEWVEYADGDFYSVKREKHSPIEGWHPGSGLAFSIQQLKEGFNDPMVFEKQNLDNLFYTGNISRVEWGKLKRQWMLKAYLGQEYKLGRLKIRPGYVPFLTPFFLFRGWWVDKMGLDWESFKLVFRKNNKETWEKLKKIIGI